MSFRSLGVEHKYPERALANESTISTRKSRRPPCLRWRFAPLDFPK